MNQAVDSFPLPTAPRAPYDGTGNIWFADEVTTMIMLMSERCFTLEMAWNDEKLYINYPEISYMNALYMRMSIIFLSQPIAEE